MPAEPDLVDVRRLVLVDEVLLELEPAVVGPDLGADRVVAHRQERRRGAQAVAQGQGDVGRAHPGPQSVGPPQVRREVAVAEPEPRVLAVSAASASMTVPGLVAQTPAAVLVVEAGQRVGDRVVVRPDGEPGDLEVVAGVDHDGQVRPRWAARPSASLAPPTPPASSTTLIGRAPRRPRRCGRSSARSYGAGMRTMTVEKPRSRNGRMAAARSAGEPARCGPPAHRSTPLAASDGVHPAWRAAAASSSMTIGKLIGHLERRQVAPDRRRRGRAGSRQRVADLVERRRRCSRRRPARRRSAASCVAPIRR